ncbi:phosphate ABC transporter substrate-binding protein [Fundidesulfovibrio soli]|uniref:phosphate ABC transporter substrate-binding protein n=1 Tax=Fundidesulfovibrio soli TaxID=2922716 RepID=UPI001FB00B19|nr:phosphate ABC transporter substrate-binding protein [Fundidesulfovibrio soli]
MSAPISSSRRTGRAARALLRFSLLAVLCLSLLGLGCQREKADRSLLIAGSSTVQPFAKHLSEAFAAKNEGLRVVCDGGGSTAGLLAVKTGAIDVAGLSRDMSRSEDSDKVRNFLLAKNAIAIIAHPDNPVSNLTMKQVKDVFSGQVTNWSELGGPDMPIALLSRKSSSTTRRGLEEAALEGEDMAKGAKLLESGKLMAGEIQANPWAIGYAALPDLGGEIKVLTIDTVELNRETVLSGRYPLARAYYFAIGQTATPWAKRFVEFAISGEGQALLEKEQLVRVY